MNLYSEEDILLKQIESWQGSADSRLNTEKDKKEFKDMLNGYYRYSMVIINSQCEAFPSKPLIMALLLSQHNKIVQLLMNRLQKIEQSKEK
jgi:hypothetical protein